MVAKIGSLLHSMLVEGALSKGGTWGGPECIASIDMKTHVIESVAWLLFSLFLYNKLDMYNSYVKICESIRKNLDVSPSKRNFRSFELVLSFIHIAMYFQIIYYKFNIFSLVNLVQPCHVILLLQGIALYSNGSTGVLITIFILPALTGTLLATLFPDITGLDQPLEKESYFIQHYLIQVVPIYLMCRHNFLPAIMSSFKTILMGSWILLVLHFTFFELLDLFLKVNVEFMLCPTGAMVDIAGSLPVNIMWPSHRSTLAVVVFLAAFPMSYMYIGISNVIRSLTMKSHEKQK